jgi:hypothetical protein
VRFWLLKFQIPTLLKHFKSQKFDGKITTPRSVAKTFCLLSLVSFFLLEVNLISGVNSMYMVSKVFAVGLAVTAVSGCFEIEEMKGCNT